MTLETRERIPNIRPKLTTPSKIASFDQLISLIKAKTAETGRSIGLYPELKHPSYFRSIGKQMETLLIEKLKQNNLNERNSPVFIQCFEPASLKMIRPLTPLKLVLLVENRGHEIFGKLDGLYFSNDVVSKKGLKIISEFVDVVGCHKEWVIQRDLNNNLLSSIPSTITKQAHRLGMAVHVWTFRPENEFIPDDLKYGSNATHYGDSVREIQLYLQAGIDGFFTDAPDIGRRAIDTLNDTNKDCPKGG